VPSAIARRVRTLDQRGWPRPQVRERLTRTCLSTLVLPAKQSRWACRSQLHRRSQGQTLGVGTVRFVRGQREQA
jgi:hypothetical protein